MTKEQKEKLLELREANKKYAEKLEWENNILLQECLKALGEYRIINDETEIMQILSIANSADTPLMNHSADPLLVRSHTYYVVWDNVQVPIIECKGTDILRHWDDVMAVAFDTCFVDRDYQSAIFIRG